MGPGRCERCAFPSQGGCLCPEIPRLRVSVRVVVLRHASEIPRLSNSARWAAAALQGSVLVDHARGHPPSDAAVAEAIGEGPAALLFPSPHPPDPAAPRPRTLVVPDGSWTQARRMVQRLAPLRQLPRLSLAPPPPGPRLRESTVAGGMSTLEAIAAALEQLGEGEAARRLGALHRAAVEKGLRLRGTWPA
jgi:DTW domain-containing protein YfiP